jgi:cytochrome b pre-mRNA-processing protein 3
MRATGPVARAAGKSGKAVSMLKRLFGDRDERSKLAPLYRAIVAEGRNPFWYREGRVPDTLDGRFDMIAALLSLVLLRFEQEDERGRAPSALLTEVFVDDMDGQLRQMGIGDIVVGKHIGKMMAALGGRLTAYREALAGDGDLKGALERNLYRGEPAEPAAVAAVAGRLRDFHRKLAETTFEALIEGRLPTP